MDCISVQAQAKSRCPPSVTYGYRLTEDRDSRAYTAALTYALIYPAGKGTPDRREEFTVPIYTLVAAVPLVERGRPVGATARHPGADPLGAGLLCALRGMALATRSVPRG